MNRSQPQRSWYALFTLGMAACTQLPTEAPAPPAEATQQEVVAGEAARSEDVRFMAALFINGVFWDGTRDAGLGCGGTLIAPDLVLTAGHCLVGTPPYVVTVGNGKRRLSDHLDDNNRFILGPDGAAVARYWLHPSYDNNDANHDVALIKLARPLRGQPLAFIDSERAERRLAPPGTTATVVGWGATDKRAYTYPDDLRRGSVPVVDRATCARKADELGWSFTDQMSCAGGGRVDTCSGDSGGPLLVRGPDGQPVIAGITSFGLLADGACGIRNEPGYYGRLATLGGWVRDCAADARRCTGGSASSCRLDGYCENGTVALGVAEVGTPAAMDRQACIARAREVYDACEGGDIAATFADASGSTVQLVPSCRIKGPCRAAPGRFIAEVRDLASESECLALAQVAHKQCNNPRTLPITASFLGPEKLATRTYP